MPSRADGRGVTVTPAWGAYHMRRDRLAVTDHSERSAPAPLRMAVSDPRWLAPTLGYTGERLRTLLTSMSRPPLDLARAPLPIPLPAIPREMSEDLAERAVGGLGDWCQASRELMRDGWMPPQALTGSTIFLAFSHWDLSGGIYAREQVTLHRPVAIGEVLTVEGRIACSWMRRGRRYRIMTSRTLDGDGRTVVSSRSTGVARFRVEAGSMEGGHRGLPPEEVLAPAPDLEAGSRNPRAEAVARLEIGQRIGGPSLAVSLEMMRAEAGTDSRNPIHTDPKVARREGLEKPIAGGPHVLAFVQEALMRELGPLSLLWGSHFDVRWVRPVETGAVISPLATVASVETDRVVLDLAVKLGDGETAMVGEGILPRGRREME